MYEQTPFVRVSAGASAFLMKMVWSFVAHAGRTELTANPTTSSDTT